MNFLLDTNILSELQKPEPDRRVLSWLTQNEQRSLLSVIVLGELTFGAGAVRASRPMRAAALDSWREHVTSGYDNRLVAVDRGVAEEWGRLTARIADTPVSPSDALIAATALVHGLTVATRNVRHFERTGVRVVNPFEG